MKKAALVVAVSAILQVPANASASPYTRARAAVCHYFPDCSFAMSVVRCETGGTYDPRAQNGQYLGIFQMGSAERRRFGHSPNVWGQARAAFAYFRLAGWRPWACA